MEEYRFYSGDMSTLSESNKEKLRKLTPDNGNSFLTKQLTIKKFFTEAPFVICFLKKNDTPIGWSCGRMMGRLKLQVHTYVHPDHRDQGLGSSLTGMIDPDFIPDEIKDRVRVPLPMSGATATVSKNCSPETLKALDKLALLAKEQAQDGI